MTISLDELRRVMPRCKQPADWIEPLNAAAQEFGIESAEQWAAWLAQIAVESGELNRLEENLNYSAAGLMKTWPKRFPPYEAEEYAHQPERIANKVYGGRIGNGDEASGDGWRYRGRGAGITGRENYRRCGEALGLDLEGNPEQAAEPEVVCRAFGWFWQSRGCNELADKGAFQEITRRINGGLIGLTERMAYWNKAKEVLEA